MKPNIKCDPHYGYYWFLLNEIFATDKVNKARIKEFENIPNAQARWNRLYMIARMDNYAKIASIMEGIERKQGNIF